MGGWRETGTTAAAYGEHTDDVLEALGLGDDELLELRANGTIW